MVLSEPYGRFITGFSQVAVPLFALTGKGIQYACSAACQQAFDELKCGLTTTQILSFPNFECHFKVATDESSSGLGAVSFQEYHGRKHVVAYASRTLRIDHAERNYSVTGCRHAPVHDSDKC